MNSPFLPLVPALRRKSRVTSPEYCPDTQATWQVNPYARSGPVVVFGGARSLISEHLLDQDAHVFRLTVLYTAVSDWGV